MKRLKLNGYEGGEGFIHRYQKLVKEVMIPYQYEVMHDRVPGVEKSHVIANFKNAANVIRGKDAGDGFYGMVFQDSDAAKWLEAAAYTLVLFPDPELESKADEIIELIARAQDEDGYLDTCFTIKDKDRRWKNLLEGHEMYCMGHMMEAAAAYYEATGKKQLLEVMERASEHIYEYFITEGHPGYPGHPEVELALLRMYDVTKKEKYMELAARFINTRGVDKEFYTKEAKERTWTIWGNDPKDLDYQQCQAPVREQSDATGHSVRAVYLYTGMADLASKTNDGELKLACERLWESITERRMYVTGGIGSTGIGEAFTVDYDLPNQTTYAETCASIGLMFFASKMLEMGADSKYSNVMERAFYNTVLAGMQLDGRRFFYVNPLEVIPGISGKAVTHKHDLPSRPGWYSCACCPPNVARIISSFAQYAYGEEEETAFCHLFMAGKMQFENGMKVECATEYPYGFTVRYQIIRGGKNLAVRRPDWSETFTALKNGQRADCREKKGYVYFSDLRDGDVIEITLDESVKRVHTTTKVPENTGKVAIQRGPLVYCIESVDNEGDAFSLVCKKNGEAKAYEYRADELSGSVKITIEGKRMEETEDLYSWKQLRESGCVITAVPYYTWGNRGAGQMRVWIPEQ